ncbi:MAG: M48 family metalloprotease [Polyangiales bacterium]
MRTMRLPSRDPSYGQPSMLRQGAKMRLLIGFAVAAFALFSYFQSAEINPVTGESQHISLTPRQEIAMGLQAAPEMARQYGGLHPDRNAQAMVEAVGQKVVQNSAAKDTQWQFDFHLLADSQTVNAFALPGGQIFITAALFSRLQTEGQLAGVLGHEIGHVIARHSAQRMAKSQLTQGLIGAVAVASQSANAAQTAQMVGEMINIRYGQGDELQSDRLGVKFMAQAGYDPRSMIGVMKILEEASGGARQTDFFSTHPSPTDRIGRIEEAIAEDFPNGVPSGLTP